MPDVSYEAFFKLLEYLYTGDITQLTVENLAQVDLAKKDGSGAAAGVWGLQVVWCQ